MKLSAELTAFSDRIGYSFARPELLIRALTHASVSSPGRSDNERLEFLGDRVLGLVMAEAVIEAEENLQTLRQMADAERRRKLALMAAEQEAEANAARVRINAEADKIAAEARGVIGKKEAETQQIKAEAEAKGFAARIAAENTRSAEAHALEMEKARLAAMPKIIGEMVKPAEKITGININHVSGLGKSSGDAPASPVNQTVESILDMAVNLPAMQRLGEQIGLSLDATLDPNKTSGRKKDS